MHCCLAYADVAWPMHPGLVCRESGHTILMGTMPCTYSMTSPSRHVGTMGKHDGPTPYASWKASPGTTATNITARQRGEMKLVNVVASSITSTSM